MSEPSASEQLLIELVNRARAAPADEAAALIPDPSARIAVQEDITTALTGFNVDVAAVDAALSGFDPAPPVAWNAALGRSAETHSTAMISADMQAHELPGQPGLAERITTEGYEAPTILAENVFGYAADPVHAHASFVIDWGVGPGGIQSPASHRETVLNPQLTEIGVGIVEVPGEDTELGPYAVTQHFGARFEADAALTGVLISDADADEFYDIGEGLGEVRITAENAALSYETMSYASGGYTLPLPDGTYTVTFEGGELDGAVTHEVTIAGQNVKLDISYLDAVPAGAILGTRGSDAAAPAPEAPTPEPPDPDATPAPAPWITGTPGRDEIRALDGDDVILASAGSDRIAGGKGSDMLVYAGASTAYKVTELEGGLFRVAAPNGDTDLLSGVERIDFKDGNLLLDLESEFLGFGYRVYQAAFGRIPGEDGLRFWVGELDRGMAPDEVASRFAQSPEFYSRYGDNPSDEDFITALYQNVLGRTPDADGFTYWLGQFDSGGLGRSDMLVAFAESKENVSRASDNLEDGVFVLNGADDIVLA